MTSITVCATVDLSLASTTALTLLSVSMKILDVVSLPGFDELNTTVAELANTIAIQGQQLAELQTKATYYDYVLKSEDAVPITVIAKDYGWSAQKLNSYLYDKRVQYKVNDTWVLYTHLANKGYTKSETIYYFDYYGKSHTKIHTKWTQAGRLFIYSLMSADGNFPLMEQGCQEG